jgi:hypothetical protein
MPDGFASLQTNDLSIRNHQAGRDVPITQKQQNDNIDTRLSSLK